MLPGAFCKTALRTMYHSLRWGVLPNERRDADALNQAARNASAMTRGSGHRGCHRTGVVYLTEEFECAQEMRCECDSGGAATLT